MESNALGALVLVVAAGCLGIGYELRQFRYALLALVSLSAKKGSLSPVNWEKLSQIGPNGPQSPTPSRIHFPSSMFPEQTEEDYQRKHPPQLR